MHVRLSDLLEVRPALYAGLIPGLFLYRLTHVYVYLSGLNIIRPALYAGLIPAVCFFTGY